MVFMQIYINFRKFEIIIIRITAAPVFLFIIKNIFNNYFDPYPISWLQGWIARPRSEDLMSLCLSACFSAFFRAPVFFFGILSQQKNMNRFFRGSGLLGYVNRKFIPLRAKRTLMKEKITKLRISAKFSNERFFWKFFRNQKMHINIFSDFND